MVPHFHVNEITVNPINGCDLNMCIEGKVQDSLKSILMKRAIEYKQNSENVMKIGQKIREL